MTEFAKNLLIGIIITISLGYAVNFTASQNNKTPEIITETQETKELGEDTPTLSEIESQITEVLTTETPKNNEKDELTKKIDTLEEMFSKIISKNITEEVPKTPSISFDDINTASRKSLVNILCTTKSGGLLKPVSGSGVIVDPKGIILTNAHVAQYYLLKDYYLKDYIQCYIRSGSPAKTMYKAEPIYISEKWIMDNADKINQQRPEGTGENDFAFLAITESAQAGIELPESFDYTPITKGASLAEGDSVFIGAYPAGFLSGASIQKDLYVTTTVGKIDEIFTFEIGTADLITVDGAILSQHGASGGAVIDKNSDLIGLVVTSTEADSTADRVLGAITMGHVQISLLQQTGEGIDNILNGNIKNKIETFRDIIGPPLKKALFDVLK